MSEHLERMALVLRQLHRKRPPQGERKWHIAPDLVEEIADELAALAENPTGAKRDALRSLRDGTARVLGYLVVVDEEQPPRSMAMVRRGPEI
jgi:hypothetical protein